MNVDPRRGSCQEKKDRSSLFYSTDIEKEEKQNPGKGTVVGATAYPCQGCKRVGSVNILRIGPLGIVITHDFWLDKE
jgi:hypothetical protein